MFPLVAASPKHVFKNLFLFFTETPFLSENELPESARLSFTKSDGTVENERAMDELGGEEIGLAKAIEESVREQKKSK